MRFPIDENCRVILRKTFFSKPYPRNLKNDNGFLQNPPYTKVSWLESNFPAGLPKSVVHPDTHSVAVYD